MHQPGSRAPTGLFSTLAGHGQLVLRMVAVEALELDLRPNAFAKGSVAFVRPSASWLEGLLGGDGDYSVDVVLWGCGTATQAALDSRQKSKGQILRRMRQLHLADLRLAAELKRLEEGFFDAGGDWTADLEPRLREWVDRRQIGARSALDRRNRRNRRGAITSPRGRPVCTRAVALWVRRAWAWTKARRLCRR